MNRFAILAVGYCLSAIAAVAQPELGGRDETSHPRFEDLDPAQKQALRDRYRRHQELSAEERRKIERQFQIWRELSPEQKQKLRKLNDQLQHAPPEQGAEMTNRMERFSQLPPERQKEALRRMMEQRDEGQRGERRDRRPHEPRQPSPERQQALAQEYPVWKELSPAQQRTLNFMHQRVDGAPPETKARLERWMEKFRQLPAERQKEMLDRISRRLAQRGHDRGQRPPRPQDGQRPQQDAPPPPEPGRGQPPPEDRPTAL